ncbi:protein of unknown function [Cupriavidus taiwanensis]|nr:protein of unknown function [Cupriavidus taiwanensis]
MPPSSSGSELSLAPRAAENVHPGAGRRARPGGHGAGRTGDRIVERAGRGGRAWRRKPGHQPGHPRWRGQARHGAVDRRAQAAGAAPRIFIAAGLCRQGRRPAGAPAPGPQAGRARQRARRVQRPWRRGAPAGRRVGGRRLPDGGVRRRHPGVGQLGRHHRRRRRRARHLDRRLQSGHRVAVFYPPAGPAGDSPVRHDAQQRRHLRAAAAEVVDFRLVGHFRHHAPNHPGGARGICW